jgi:hypothetical protein
MKEYSITKTYQLALEKMDKDLAIQFVFSGISLDPKKVEKQFITVSQIQAIRTKDKNLEYVSSEYSGAMEKYETTAGIKKINS